jgi:zinc resistance-associated protein
VTGPVSIYLVHLTFVEEEMLKPLIAGTAILAIAGSSLVYAQQRFGERDGFHHGAQRAEHRHWPSAANMAAFTDARIAALKAGLELTPDQQKYWPQFEQALRDMAQLRIQRVEAREARAQQGSSVQQGSTPQQGGTAQQGQSQTGPFARLARRADNLAQRGTALKKVADAGAPLYQSLTDAQKGRFKVLARMLRPHRHMRMAFNERAGGWKRGGDMGQGGQGFGGGHRHHFRPGGDNNDGQGSQL